MRIIITTGGTGGHIFPALALAKEILEKEPHSSILFVGGTYGMEKELCKKADIPFIALEVQGFIGKGLKSIKALYLLIKAYFQAKALLKKEEIDCVIGFGGYASAPCILAARSLKRKIYFHEQNAFPGAVHRYFASFADKIMLSIPIEKGIYSENITKKCIITGNPVRKEIAQLTQKEVEKSQGKKLLILGGSLGAKSINTLIVSLLELLHIENIEITHQCGAKEYEKVSSAYKDSPYPSSCVHSFIEDMQKAYRDADIIIARAGASSLAELACVAKPVILIPFPFAAHNHQFYNAKSLEEKEACILIEEKEMYKNETIINKELLFKNILLLLNSREKSYALAQNIRLFAKPSAVSNMLNIIKEGEI